VANGGEKNGRERRDLLAALGETLMASYAFRPLLADSVWALQAGIHPDDSRPTDAFAAASSVVDRALPQPTRSQARARPGRCGAPAVGAGVRIPQIGRCARTVVVARCDRGWRSVSDCHGLERWIETVSHMVYYLGPLAALAAYAFVGALPTDLLAGPL
jgi:hypothetical protein